MSKAKGSTGQPPWFQIKSEDQKKFLKSKVVVLSLISESILILGTAKRHTFRSSDQVLGNEHSMEPPILIASLSENLFMENTEQSLNYLQHVLCPLRLGDSAMKMSV